MELNVLLSFIFLFCLLAYFRASLGTFTFATLLFMLTTTMTGLLCAGYWFAFLIIAVPLNIRSIRRVLLTTPIFKLIKHRLPPINATEKAAIEAGSSWWEAELFRGAPDWQRLHHYPAPRLSPEEQAFIDGPLEELCCLCNEWEISHQYGDLPPEIWHYLKQHHFFALTIDKQYGGLGFSAFAISSVLQKVASLSPVLASTISAPNAVGPTNLIQQYGTVEQKNHYLPKLAQGKEIPCFALTSIEAGSDINAITDEGIICKDLWHGTTTLGIRLSWSKRYVTLAPVSTLIGLAFKLKDPEQLLGKQLNIGITCALIPSQLEGIDIGRRHCALNTPFQTGPTHADNIFIPLDHIIGGPKMAGQGLTMLLQCLSVSRGLVLPASCTGSAKMAALASGAYSRIRHQFDQAIGSHQGIEEPLARLGGNTYLMDATMRLTVTGLDMGESPSVISSIVKYHLTHRGQQALIDAMLIHGGKGICIGPKNYLAHFYQAAPISTTVEGANILTRSLIIYGQGAIRSHPYLLNELTAARMKDPHLAIELFDRSIFSHLGYTISNLVRSLWFTLTGAYLFIPPFKDHTARYYQILSRYSTHLALLSDITIALLGKNLKHKERISARLGDILSYLYLASATLKRFDDEGRHKADKPLLDWAIRDCLMQLENSLESLLNNFPNKIIASLLRLIISPFGKPNNRQQDITEHHIAMLLQTPGESRERLGAGRFTTLLASNPAAKLDIALDKIIAAEPLVKKIAQALGSQPHFRQLDELAEKALKINIINQNEAEILRQAELARLDCMMVDDFKNWPIN